LSTVVCAWSSKHMILGADSRITLAKLEDNDIKDILFFDDAQKIFVFPNSRLGMAYAGPVVLQGSPISYRIRDLIEAEDVNGRSPTQILQLFLQSLSGCNSEVHVVIPPSLFLLVAGYSNGVPVCAFLQNQVVTCLMRKRGFLSNDAGLSRRWLIGTSEAYLIQQVSSRIESRASSKRGVQTTGGPTDILRISRDSCTWLQRKPRSRGPEIEASLLAAVRKIKGG
jgi:hypothetical protein